jgi:signal transduction histidine kinase
LYATVATAVAAAFAFRNRPEPGAIEFAATMFSFSVWSGSMSLNRSGVLADRSHLLLYLVAFSILGSGIAWLFFSINYTGRDHWLTRRRCRLVFAYSAVYTVLVCTNEYHQLVYRLPEDSTRITVDQFGLLFFASGVLSWVFTVVGTGLLVHLAINSRNVYRKMSRFLRHNIRNEMNIARSRVRMVHEQLEQYDESLDEDLKEALDIMDKIVERSSKARSVENIAEGTNGRVDLELQKLIRGVLSEVHDQYPDVELQYDPGQKTWVSASEHVDMAIENLVENAIEHNDAASRWVRVSTENRGDTVEVHIEDNGPGIPEHEIEVLEAKQETDLQHGSGFGLWLVSWILDRSDGTVSFDVTDSGTTVVVTLKTVDRPDQ